MDNTELHYLSYDPDAIWEQMQMAYIEAGGDTLYPGDEKEMLLRSVLSDIVQVFAGVDNALRMQTLRYAVGDYLDLIGEGRACPRIEAAAATVPVRITARATGAPSVIPAGTSMTADGEVNYALTEDLNLSGYAQTLTVTVTCDREGSVGNGLAAGTQMYMATASAVISSIVALENATGGNDREDDETYRTRIRQSGLASVTTGPARQYRQAAMAVSSDILDAGVTGGGAGVVNIYLLLSDEAVAASVIQAVEEALSSEDTRPLTDRIVVQQAQEITYTINVEYECQNVTSAVQTAIAQAAAEYQAWQDGAIGQPFNPDRLAALIYQAGASRVQWGEGSEFDGGTVEYTAIDPSERCKGTITLTHIS